MRAARAMVGGLVLEPWLSGAAATPAQPTPQTQIPPPCCALSPAQSAVPDVRGTAQAPLSVRVVQLPATLPRAESSPTDWNGRIMAGATVLLAFVTWMLWLATRALVRGADETAKRELRAYVFAEDARIEGVAEGDNPVATVPLKNSGQTPAYKVRVSVRQELRAAFVDMPAFEESKVLGHLAPGAVLTVMAPSVGSLDRSGYAGLDSGHFTLFVYGIVHYIDAFRVPHWTRFRVMVGGLAGLRAKSPDGSLALVSCAEGNETDDDI